MVRRHLKLALCPGRCRARAPQLQQTCLRQHKGEPEALELPVAIEMDLKEEEDNFEEAEDQELE